MSGLLSVVTGNPRRRRRKSTRRRRRTSHARATTHRRRRRTHNPTFRRRRRARRVGAHRRRRHRNPSSGGGSVTPQAFVKAITGIGVGAVASRVIANAAKNMFIKDPAQSANPMIKIGLEAGAAIVGGMLVAKVLKQRALGHGIMVGGAVVVALDLYTQYIEPHLPMTLKDYDYGTLQGWAPQPGLAPAISSYQTGSLSGPGVYDGGVYE